MSIIEENVNEVLEGIKPVNKRCLICNKDDSVNVCKSCDGRITAMKVYRQYLVYMENLSSKYQFILSKNKNIKDIDKQTEFAKIMNSRTVTKKLDSAEELYKKQFTEVGLSGLDSAERTEFFQSYGNEINTLKANKEYAYRVLGYNEETGMFYKEAIDYYDDLKKEYKKYPRE